MIIVVVSGFIGRYFYTALPRTVDGIELEASVLEAEIVTTDSELQHWLESQTDESTRWLAQRVSASTDTYHSQLSLVIGRTFMDWRYRLQWWFEKRRLSPGGRAQAGKLEELLNHRRQLHRQVASLAMARRLLSLWHTVHIPIGMALFTAAFVHIFAAIYYATLLR